MRILANRATAIAASGGLLGGLLVSAPAFAAVTNPFPGLTLVREGAKAMVIADLCAPGVAVRTTKYAERKATPQTWGAARGLQAAMNGDFFDFPAATYVLGRARGGGEDWPAAQQQHENHHYFEFGPGFSNWINPGTNAPTAGATEIVGSHNPVIMGGALFTDGAIDDLHPRSAIGLNLTRTRLFMFSSKDSISGATVTSSMFAMSAEANGGTPDIDIAVAVDGGGSSQLYVQGLGQIVTSGRLVANHLGVFATGSGPSPQCPGAIPTGAFDVATCTELDGWAEDLDDKAASISALLTFNGPFAAAGAQQVTGPAADPRPDVTATVGSPNHGFSIDTPYGIFDGAEHSVFAYAVSKKGLIGAAGGEKKLTCAFALPPSKKRRIGSPDVYTAWKLNDFVDRFPEPTDETSINAQADGTDILSGPSIVRDETTNAIYWVDGDTLRLVRDPVAWHFDLTKAEVRPSATIATQAKGIPLRQRPMIIRAKSTGAIYILESLVDENPPPPDAGAGTGDAGWPWADGGKGTPNASDAANGDSSGCQASPQKAVSFGFLALGLALPLAALRRSRRRT